MNSNVLKIGGKMKKIRRIHILGASGSGTTTLGAKLSQALDFKHFDTDDYCWEATIPKFKQARPVEERLKMLMSGFEKHDKWIFSGSLVSWGNPLIPYFDLVIFLRIPPEIRLDRLKNREIERYGNAINPGQSRHENHLVFMDWASQYDDGDENVRSYHLHNKWLSELDTSILKIEEDIDLDEKVERIKAFIQKLESES